MTFRTKVNAFMTEHQMLSNGGRVLVGLSGGADSVALLSFLHELASRDSSIQLAAVHVNHQLREEAQRDQAFCEALCRKKQIPFYAEQTDVAAISQREHLSLEDAGRQERYRIFQHYQKELCCDVIATAHHRDDAAETVLMRLLRGCGPEGLQGILPVREDGVIRPFLSVSKAEILDYLKQIDQDYVTDETNFSCDYTRNRIRSELIPHLEKQYNPAIGEALFRLSALALQDNAFLEKQAEIRFASVGKPNGEEVRFSKELLRKEEPAMRSRLIQKAYQSLTGQRLSYHLVKLTEALLDRQTGKQISLPGGISAEIQYGSFVMHPAFSDEKGFSFPITDGFFRTFPETGFQIRARRSDRKENGKNSLSLPADGQIAVRSRREGDHMHLPGTGEKKLKNIFIDKKIPRSVRECWPLITYQGEIVWMAGFYKNEVRASGNQYYIITIEKIGEGTYDAQ